ncbi:MAG: Gfo/Idh/MocA family oxidoreductase [Blastocatellia bacterium]
MKNQSRRQFVKNTAAVTTASLAASTFTIVNAESVRGTKANSTVQIGWVGQGGQGTRDAQLLEQTGKAKIVALADYFQYRLDKAKGPFKVDDKKCYRGIDAYKAIMSDSSIDAVLLTTPPGFRPEHFRAAVAAKKHVYAEKPLGVDGPGVRMVAEAGEKALAQKLSVVVGLQRHYSRAYRACKKMIDEGALGTIGLAHSAWDQGDLWQNRRAKYDKSKWPTQMDWEVEHWYYFKWLCGDHIVEQNIHNIDVINWMLGSHPLRASGFGARTARTEIGDINDHFAITYEYSKGIISSNTCIQIDGTMGDVSETIRGSKATFTTSNAKGGTGTAMIIGQRKKGMNEDPILYKYEGEPDKHYDQEAATFVASVLGTGEGEDKYRNDTKYGVESTLTAIMGRDAAYKGRVITWEEAWNLKEKLAFKGGA